MAFMQSVPSRPPYYLDHPPSWNIFSGDHPLRALVVYLFDLSAVCGKKRRYHFSI